MSGIIVQKFTYEYYIYAKELKVIISIFGLFSGSILERDRFFIYSAKSLSYILPHFLKYVFIIDDGNNLRL